MPSGVLLGHAHQQIVHANADPVNALTRMLCAVMALLAGEHARAQNQHLTYPVKPIRLIVPYPPGAGADGTGRALADSIVAALGQQVVAGELDLADRKSTRLNSSHT